MVPEMMSVFPKLSALLGMPNPMVTKPAAIAARPNANRTRFIGFSVPSNTRAAGTILNEL
jgi:hypothetical protein